jgi:hypothetical protein
MVLLADEWTASLKAENGQAVIYLSRASSFHRDVRGRLVTDEYRIPPPADHDRQRVANDARGGDRFVREGRLDSDPDRDLPPSPRVPSRIAAPSCHEVS